MPKVSDEHKDNVRRRIMDAALVCLVRNDYQDVTTRELLTEASLSTGTFYNYFPSKEHLYEALAEELLAEDVSRIINAAATGGGANGSDGGGGGGGGDGGGVGGGAGAGLLSLLRDYMLADSRAAIAVANFRSRTTGDEAMAAITRLNAWIVDEFTPLVTQAQADGFIRDDIDPRALVELLDLVWNGLGHRAAQGSFQTSYQQVGHVLLQVMATGALAASAERPIDLTPQPVPPPAERWQV